MTNIINTEKGNGLSVQFVQREYFVKRVFELQEKYKEQWSGWYEFLQAYVKRDSSIDFFNFELEEWAFLCTEFESDLLLSEVQNNVGLWHDSEPPPERHQTHGSDKPERRSGFRFGELVCLTPHGISTLCNGRSIPATIRQSLVAGSR